MVKCYNFIFIGDYHLLDMYKQIDSDSQIDSIHHFLNPTELNLHGNGAGKELNRNPICTLVN